MCVNKICEEDTKKSSISLDVKLTVRAGTNVQFTTSWAGRIDHFVDFKNNDPYLFFFSRELGRNPSSERKRDEYAH